MSGLFPRNKGFAHLPLLSVLFVILFSIGMYLVLGNPGAIVAERADHTPMTASSKVVSPTGKTVASVASMTDGLAARLEREPDDAAGWLLLAKSYRHLGRIEDARAAYTRATALGKSDASLDSSLVANAGMTPANVEVRGRINISDEAALTLNGTDTVFVVAKAVGGSPMPLAVLRRQASDLPFDFVLNEETSMVPGLGLSSAEQIVVSAKISKTGDALDTEQAFEVKSGAISTGEPVYLELFIDHAVAAAQSQADTGL